ncbi:MAG TPA: glutamine--fructose-6-phosphate transaminase (isomerizing) [Nitrososphaeraceae archaeon]|nr:glutamine--fructose-6-phosphate transaminase (isomerizing) [Nitrososphaeraceae archaeon]
MCSIIGYKGNLSAVAPVLVESLQKMEYRGYDSVGLATVDSGKILIRKGIGKVAEVTSNLNLEIMPGHMGIGHTRWATHGGILDKNAHPHYACNQNIAIVHNGIIENYKELKEELIRAGHKFQSDTDSEVIAHLLESNYNKQSDIKTAVMETCRRIKGAYSFVAIFECGSLAGARYDEPLIIGIADDGFFISSDVLGFIRYTDKAIFLDNKDMVIFTGGGLELFDSTGVSVSRQVTKVAWELGAADKGKYAHHTLKEIHEQNRTIMKALDQEEKRVRLFCDLLSNSKNLYITGSGSSYHSALIAKHILRKYVRLKAETVMSSEFQYAPESIDNNSVLLAISQSGETADVLQSVKIAKEKGSKILSIVNVSTSSLARMSDCFLNLNSGPEIGVAATKSFTAQLSLIYHIADVLSNNSVGISSDKELLKALDLVMLVEDDIIKITEHLREVKDIYILGRSLHYPVALEGALKVKELTYIHAEGIAAGELKHGPLALIDTTSVVIIINPHDATFDDILSNAHELKARGATVIALSDKRNDVYDYYIPIPKVKDSLYPIVEVIPFQMLAYYLALKKNANPDYPRNLAKSVTVR